MRKSIIIGEAGVNHNGSLAIAKQLIDIGAEAGVDYVKFQTFKADQLTSKSATKASYQLQNTDVGESQQEMLRRLELTPEMHLELAHHCQARGTKFLSTPFDIESIDLLRKMGVSVGKIPSGEITNLPYLKKMAITFPEIILSTGMSEMLEVEEAINVLTGCGLKKDNLVVLHCNTEYPTPFVDVNLRAMQSIAEKFMVRVGYSDHTNGIEVPIAAVALGASVIEKHFTSSRSLPGPDHQASLEPSELKAMVLAIRNIELAMGDGIKKSSPSEKKNIPVARKSIHLKADVPSGFLLSEADLTMKRPGDGISPMKMMDVLGKKTKKALKADHKLNFNDLV